MNQYEIIAQFHKKTQRWDTQASTGLLLTNAPRPLTVAGLEATAMRIQHLLAQNRAWVSAFNTLWAAKDYAKYRNEANADILTRLHHGELVTGESLLELIENPNVVVKLTVNAAYREQQQQANEREQLIQYITQGQSRYSWHDGRHGKMRSEAADHLYEESTERLQEIADILRQQREAVAAKSLGWKLPTAQQQGDEFKLINPNTGAEYTKPELIKVVNGPRENLRRLFLAPDGTMRPQVKEAVERILRS